MALRLHRNCLIHESILLKVKLNLAENLFLISDRGTGARFLPFHDTRHNKARKITVFGWLVFTRLTHTALPAG